jgi:uncharacterized membrane protein
MQAAAKDMRDAGLLKAMVPALGSPLARPTPPPPGSSSGGGDGGAGEGGGGGGKLVAG